MAFYSAHTLDLDTNEWSKTGFEKRKDVVAYINKQVKYPGEYNLKYTEGCWNDQAKFFQKQLSETGKGSYPSFRKGSIDFRRHWDFEKEKCLFEGFIIYKKPSENLEFAVPCLYYWYLNYCPIPDKVKQHDDFPEVYDGDYHYFLYILRCILLRKFSVVLKKRQCLLPDSVIFTPTGYHRIDELERRNYKGEVCSFDVTKGKQVVDTVLEVFKAKVVNEYIKIQTNSGHFVECSNDHKIYTKEGWKRADEIKKTDFLVLYNSSFGEINVSEAEAKVVGYFITDGSYSQKNIVPKFTNITSEFLEDFEEALLEFSPESTITKHSKGKGFDFHIVSSDKNKGTANKFKRWLFVSGFCKKGKERTLPDRYLNMPKKQTSLLLNRMFAANGWIHKIQAKSVRYEIGIASMSVELIHQIQTMLHRYGIVSRINKESDEFFKLRIMSSGSVNTFIKEIGVYKKDREIQISKIQVTKQTVDPTKVKKIKIIRKKKQLYDIATRDQCSFFANGVYVHNSGYSLKNMAIILNAIWFGQSAITKIFAKDIAKVKESWSFMELYRDHINSHCGWTRGFDPGKKLNWEVRRRQTDGSFKGNRSKAIGLTTKQDPTNGIGGTAKVIFGEEGGANDTLDVTHEFISSNVAYGSLVTGLISYSGAVGKLEAAEPLKEFMTRPEQHNFLGCPNNIADDLEYGDKVGFFVPEWWNYVSVEEDEEGNPIGEALKCFDEWGNTDKEKAIREVLKWRKLAEQKNPEKFRFYCSQRPLSIREAFAYRKESRFPMRLVQAQKRRIENKEYFSENVDIARDEKGDLNFVRSSKLPITDFPLSAVAADKEGCIVVYERPFTKRPELGKFYAASIDPIQDGKTTTSVSLFTILIYKLDVEVTKYGENDPERYIEPGKIVCEWSGRFDDPNKTNERAMLLLEMYGAMASVEVNNSTFVNYMITAKRAYYLVPKSQLFFLKELGSNESAFQDYGWKNTGDLFDRHLIAYIVDFMKEELDRKDIMVDGELKEVKVKYGVERLSGSMMILKEMEAYVKGMNVDRLIALGGLVAYVKVLIANKGYVKRTEQGEKRKVDPTLYVKQTGFFKNFQKPMDSKYKVNRRPFKNF